MSGAAVNKGVQISQLDSDFNYFRYIPRRGITGSSGNSISNFLRNLLLFSITAAPFYIIFTRVSISPHPCQHSLPCSYFFFLFLSTSNLIGNFLALTFKTSSHSIFPNFHWYLTSIISHLEYVKRFLTCLPEPILFIVNYQHRNQSNYFQL